MEEKQEDNPSRHKACWEIWRTELGLPRYVAAPMVDMSELPFRMLCRRYGAQVCFTPMLHASRYVKDSIYRDKALSSCPGDRPLIVQFCANDPEVFAQAVQQVAPHCNGVDLNLGCPQVIAKRGHYGSFLQEEWDLIGRMVRLASQQTKLPISCKIRIFPEEARTIQYAKMLQDSGCTFLTIHGRTREQKGQATGLADWDVIKAVKASVNIPVIANGNILNFPDVERCLQYTGVDAVMSAEGLLHNPALFSGDNPPVWQIAGEFLDLCEQYPIDHGHIRTHLFRLFAYCLPLHHDLQVQLGQANSLEKLRTICSHLKARLQSLQLNYNVREENILRTQTGPVVTSGDEERKISPTSSCVEGDASDVRVLGVTMETDNTSTEGVETLEAGDVLKDQPLNSPAPCSPGTQCQPGLDMPVWLCHSRPRVKLNKYGHPLDRTSIPGPSTAPSDSEPLITVVAEAGKASVEEGKVKKLTRSQKKKLKIQQKLEGQKLRRKLTKQERKKRRAQEREEPSAEGSDSPSTEEHVSKKQRQQLIHERCVAAMESGQRVCVDLSMESLMSEKECSKLAQQLGRVYGSNRQSECPAHLYFTGLNKQGFLYAECVRKNAGFQNYLVDVHEESHLELFSHEDVIQLTPDSPNILQTMEADKVYVLGGLVDEHVLKGETKDRAEKKQVASARLPIEEYLERADKGTYKKILAINQVFDILLAYIKTRDWGLSLMAGMPARQGFVLKTQDSSS